MRLIVLSCAWVLGIFAGSQVQLPGILMFCGLLPVPAAVYWSKYRQKLVLLALSLVVFFGAASYYSCRSYNEPPLSGFNDCGTVEIRGMVETMPEWKDSLSQFELSAREITADGKAVKTEGTVLVFLPLYPEYRYGDILEVKGRLREPPVWEDFDYQAYLAGKGIFSIMYYPSVEVIERSEGIRPLAWLYSVRLSMARSLSAALPEPQASLAQGILLGIRSSIPDALKNELTVSGTTHLLAISGMNLTIVAGILVTAGLWLFGRRHYIYVWLALLMIWFYALLSGMQPPVIRSAIMTSIFLTAELLGRQKNTMVPLVFSAAVMTGITPSILWDVSFQLSFLGIAGLIFLGPLLQKAARKGITRIIGEANRFSRLVNAVSDSLCVTLGAVIAVWPVIAWNFGIISLAGPLATLLIAPVLSPIILTTALTALIGLISPPAAQVAGWMAWVFLSYMQWMVHIFAWPALASVNSMPLNGAAVGAYYFVLTIIVRFGRRLKKLADWTRSAAGLLKKVSVNGLEKLPGVSIKIIIIPLLLAAVISSLAAATAPDGDLHVCVLDVGEGDAILIRNGNQTILIDGGPGPQPALSGLGNHLPFWDRTIDLVVLTHPHLDHLTGLVEVLRNYKVENVLTTELGSSSPCFAEWNDLLSAKGVSITIARSGQSVSLSHETELEVLNPSEAFTPSDAEEVENNGIVLRLTRGKVVFLFTSDIGPESEADLIKRRADLDCTVLKVAHHGSDLSSTAGFLAVTSPEAAVISVGAENRFGHPGDETLSRLEEAEVPPENIFRTDLCGAIEFTTDGEGLWVKTER
ncbi:MAG: ComEC/Rec2 family competence protein [Dehalococcoidales bacterium]|nr:ComEC/Rec2 family competence protein [Dehalococcoidales bacterium]